MQGNKPKMSCQEHERNSLYLPKLWMKLNRSYNNYLRSDSMPSTKSFEGARTGVALRPHLSPNAIPSRKCFRPVSHKYFTERRAWCESLCRLHSKFFPRLINNLSTITTIREPIQPCPLQLPRPTYLTLHLLLLSPRLCS
jgi:hypothetical protein